MKVAEKHIREDERLQDLRSYNVLDTEPEVMFDHLTKLAAAICDTPYAFISLVEENRQWFKSKVGIDISETGREVSFCAHAILENELMEIPDASLDERFKDNPAVQGPLGIRFYAGVQLFSSRGLPLGTLCVVDTVPGKKLSQQQRKNLMTLGHQVMELLELRKNEHAAKLTIRALEEREEFLYRTLLEECPILRGVESTLEALNSEFESCDCKTKAKSKLQRFDLSKVVERVISVSKPIRDEKRIFMFSSLSEGTIIKADLHEVVKALLYLLKSSVQSLEDERENLRLISIKISHVQDALELVFSDNGKSSQNSSEVLLAKSLMIKNGGEVSYEEDSYSAKFRVKLPYCA